MSCQLEILCTDCNLKKQRLQNEDKKTTLDLRTVLNFVESKNRKQSQTMKTAYKVAKDSGMNPVWITVDQAIKLCKETKNHVFIIESFKSDLFDRLHQNSNCQIFGPACIFYCKNELYLPRRQFPILNLCMRNLVICADDYFDENDNLQMFGLINLMGGTLILELKPITTHLISDNYMTEKSRTARTYGIPIMKKEWVKECWEISLSKELNADDNKIMEKFKLPIFHGFRINISQIKDDVKAKLQDLISRNGGINVEFRPRIVTHLILGEAKGQKYDVAKQFGIKIMTQNWILESVKNGYPMLEYDYLFEPSNTQPEKFNFIKYDNILNSSPIHEESIHQSSQICSIINSQKSQICSQINSQVKTELSNTSQINTPQFNSSQELTQKDCPKPNIPEPGKTYCVKSKADLNKCNNRDLKRTAFSVLTSSQNTNKQKITIDIEEELEKLVNQLNNCKSSIFDGCDFYIYDNFRQNIKILLKRCITLQNGTISVNLRQSVSHVIVKEENLETDSMKLNEELDKFDHTIKKVTLTWIIQCSKSNKLVPVIQIRNQTESPTKKEQRSFSQQLIQQRSQSIKRSKFPRHSSLHSYPASQHLPIREIQISRADDIFNDYSDAGNLESNLMYSSQAKNEFDLDLMKKEEKPLYKCVLTFSSYQVTLKDELTKIAKRLGATCQSEFVKTDKFVSDKPNESKLKNTHLICDEAKGLKYDRALKWGIPVVNQHWLRKCQELAKRVNEQDYFPRKVDSDKQDKNKLNLQVQKTNSQLLSDYSQKSENVKFDSNQKMNKLINGLETNIIESNSTSSSQIFQNKFENLKTILKSDPQLTVSNKLPLFEGISELDKNPNIKIDIMNDDRSCFQNVATMPSIPIAWDDHQTNRQSIENASFSLPKHISNQLDLITSNKTIKPTTFDSSTLNITADSVLRTRLIEKPKEQFRIFEDSTIDRSRKKLCKFSFIGYSPQEKQEFSKKLSRLNIEVSMDNGLEYDYVITQATKLVKNECFFISIAKGKWILHPDFYHKTLELGELPDPEEYEWGPSSKYLSKLDPKFIQLAKACKYWRIKVAKTKKFAFNGQNTMIVSVNAKSFASIINNGGGNASAAELQLDNVENYTIVLSELYQKLKQGIITNLDYILINYKKKERDRLNLLKLIKPIDDLNIRCLQIDYLSLFLVSDQNLNFKTVLINSSFLPSTNLKRALNTSNDPENASNKVAKK